MTNLLPEGVVPPVKRNESQVATFTIRIDFCGSVFVGLIVTWFTDTESSVIQLCILISSVSRKPFEVVLSSKQETEIFLRRDKETIKEEK